MLKKVGILINGGDAPGLNAVIRAITRTAEKNGVECYGFIDGFNGFVNIVYIEKDNTIRFENKTYEKEGKVNAKNLKELLKEDAKKRTVEHITRYKTQEVRNVEFVDAQ